jgi:hypothetical protein
VNATIWYAIRVRDQIRREGHERVEGKIRSLPLWSEYAASLFEAKVAEDKLSSSKSRERWGNVLGRLIPVFGRLRVDEVRTADLVASRGCDLGGEGCEEGCDRNANSAKPRAGEGI